MQTRKLHSAYLLPTIMALPVVAAANAADIVWIDDTGSWGAAANWSPTQFPTAANNAFIMNNANYTVIVDPVDSTVGSLHDGGGSGTQTLSLDRTAFTLHSASVINAHGRLKMVASDTTLAGTSQLPVGNCQDRCSVGGRLSRSLFIVGSSRADQTNNAGSGPQQFPARFWHHERAAGKQLSKEY